MVQKMRKMKDSGIEWIGEIPEGWEVVKAKYLFAQRNEKGNSALVLLSPTQKYGVIPQSQLEGVVQVKENTDLRTFKTIHIGDFVISLRSFQGGFEFSNYEGVCSPAYQVLHATKDLSNDFFRYLFKSDGFISKINSLTVGIREGKNIQYWDFSNMLLALPPKEIQIRSAQYLNAKCTEIDTMLSKTRSSIEEYKKLKQAVITQAVTKGVRGEREMKDSGVEWIGMVPKEWALLPFRRVLKERNEKNTPIKSTERLSLSIELGVTLYSEKTTNLDRFKDDFEQYKLAYKGDLVMNSMNMIVGATGVSEYFGCVSPVYYTFYDDSLEHVTAKYCEYIFRSKTMLRVLYSLGKGIYAIVRGDDRVNTCRLKVSKDDLKSLIVPVPSLNEQREIVHYLNVKCAEIDKLIAKKEQLVKELGSYKKSLIYEVVTGKREV